MRKIFTILIGIVMSTVVFGQNGFELTPLELDNPIGYTIDELGNYWIISFNGGLKKYDGTTLTDIVPEVDISGVGINDVFVNTEDVFLIGYGIFCLNKDDEYSYDTVVLGTTTSVYVDGNTILRATGRALNTSTWEMDPAFVELYENKELVFSDTLHDFEGNITDVIFFNDTIFISHQNGLVKYKDGQVIEVSNNKTENLIIYNNQLWTNNGYFYANGRTIDLGISGWNIGILKNQVWMNSGSNLINVNYDHNYTFVGQGFSINSLANPFPNQNGRDKLEFLAREGLVNFNPEEYVADPGIYNSNTNKFLDINNVKALFSTSNSLFFNSGNAAYYVPKDGNVSSMYAAALWMGGIDQDDQLHVAATRFLQDEASFFPGPLRIADATTDTVTASEYHRMWHLDRGTIENFKYRVENGEVQNGNWPIDYSIETWPAHGPEGYAENLAPFVDYNNDGVYNPMDGDYPEMKGDEMFFWIINDNLATTNVETMGENMGVELHCTAWANVYENGTNDTAEVINNTTFLDVKVINRSGWNYHDMYLGLWSDVDLGYPMDDHIASDVMNHSFYVYNGDDIDEASTSGPGYEENPPAQSVTFLDAPIKNTTATADTGIYLSKFVSFYTGGDSYGNPVQAADYYNYLRGQWKDSTLLTYGGTGHDEANTLECDYMFPGDSDPNNIGTDGVAPTEPNWSQESAGFSKADQRGVGANGPFDLNTGESVNFRFAFVWARGDNGAQSSVTRLKELLPLLHEFQRTGSFPSSYDINIVPLGISETATNELGVNIYPNPANQTLNISCEAENAVYRIYNLSGQIVANGRINGQLSTIDISSLPKDLYLVHVNDGNKGYTKKLVVE
jgi:hypothetical protein